MVEPRDFIERVGIGGSTFSVKLCVLVDPRESVAVIVNVCDPVVVGVPCSNPAAVRVRPGGSVPLVKDQTSGTVPMA